MGLHTPPTPQAPVGPLWTKVFGVPKTPGH